jgi:hypothetical protein
MALVTEETKDHMRDSLLQFSMVDRHDELRKTDSKRPNWSGVL